jgi:hypothetical protein
MPRVRSAGTASAVTEDDLYGNRPVSRANADLDEEI